MTWYVKLHNVTLDDDILQVTVILRRDSPAKEVAITKTYSDGNVNMVELKASLLMEVQRIERVEAKKNELSPFVGHEVELGEL